MISNLTTILLQSFPPGDSSSWIILGVGAAVLLYMFIRPSLKRKDPLDKHPQPISLAQQRTVEREMSNLLVELSEMARQTTSQLDARAAKLELLLKEADQKIAALGAASATMKENGSAQSSVISLKESLPDPRHIEIYALADQGRSPQEIARQLDRPNGEIELILALRRRSS